MHLLVLNNVVDVSFQISGNIILNFPSDDEIVPFCKDSLKSMDLNATSHVFIHIILPLYSVRITLNIDHWIGTRESEHFQPLVLLFHSSI